ncbi:MAG: type II toxin-antitoxin system HipA family toxin [Puniceicoccales bacterium]|jgi:serine/threonine-protein kinase HipA|nr:type II toxin-antitoxin system HipA family toxin [Puniceicoccales bacterium]
MKTSEKIIHVFADWEELGAAIPMGTLFAVNQRGNEMLSFDYDDGWLSRPHSRTLDADISLIKGRQYLKDGKPNFGFFEDSSPDRWGRVLMQRREAILAKKEGRGGRRLTASDYLLGVHDEQRMGALRFKIEGKDAFQNDALDFATPPWTSLRDLEYAAHQYENDSLGNEDESLKWMNKLLAPGSSLGGARPKAGVRDTGGELWIAKFPSKDDGGDVGAWEMVAYELGKKAGLNLPVAQLRKFLGRKHTFLSKRFDRTLAGKRIHFASAMTLLGYSDGNNATTGVSYLELVEFLTRHGANSAGDIEELFRRIVFSICISNTDDHLRNHGFLLTSAGWILSPAYDINPSPYGDGLQLNISEDDNSLDLDLAKSQAANFRLANIRADEIIKQVKDAVSCWRAVAKAMELPLAEQLEMETAFRT